MRSPFPLNKIFLSFFIFSSLCLESNAQLKLPKLVSDGMVLQRDTEVKIWGWAFPSEKIRMRFLGMEYQTEADESGAWELKLSNLKAGGPHTMTIATSETLEINDILIGDVWVASGQSQIDINMERVSPLYPKEIKEANHPEIRYFSVPTSSDLYGPHTDFDQGKWVSISQDNILEISAVSYFFGLELHEHLGIPIGMIRSSLGGSPAEAWISEASIKAFPDHLAEARKFKDEALVESIEKAAREENAAWYGELNEKDAGYHETDAPWHKAQMDVSDWSQMEIPGYWADGELGNVNGSVWFRKEFELSADQAGKSGRLYLGTLVGGDSTFVNGQFVGTISYQYPPRRYHVPEGLLKEGKNSITVRLISSEGKGGFVPEKAYELVLGKDTLDLIGKWHYRLGAQMKPLRGQPNIRMKPTGLFNGMIAPLTDYAIKGVIWYQGESNTGKPKEYAELLPALIKDWRQHWGQGDFPFLWVQLPNFMESKEQPSDSNWALTRESQLKTLSQPNTGMAVAIDLGEWNDIHPLNKKDVSKRLALAARKVAYQEDVVAFGPLYESMSLEGNKIKLNFKEIGTGLKVKDGGELKEFAIAGADQKFYWAKAEIVADEVMVWHEAVPNPVAVRYAWADNPDQANLYNMEGLPASPFRTDDWNQVGRR
ncbi:sialate O-acetylesterase [Pararhodonellum marinum]|uniref:sialate O-acetylesterase n=1 Tax=Pararhodonellum marinum TaxID=2755358 RepID=UPI00188EBEAD|nr:sialate O-acetylesterase [Pararhodonellum marinum]